jgi:RHS repeat-associated protein
MDMPGRSVTPSDAYKYSFNGKINNDELYEGSQDFGARFYDNRLGRFMSTDPLGSQYAYSSPYVYAANSPVSFMDNEGKNPIIGLCGYTVTKKDGKTVVKVHLSVQINIAVINNSSVVLSKDEGLGVASALQKQAIEGTFTGILESADGKAYSSMFNIASSPDISIEYEVDIKQNFTYVNSEKEINELQDILVLVDSHEPNKDQGIGGMAHLEQGVATIDLSQADPYGTYISSVKKNLPQGNGGNHEVFHLLGAGDDYQYKNFVLVKDDRKSLMGTNQKEFGSSQEQIDNIVRTVLVEFVRLKKQTSSYVEAGVKFRGGGFWRPKYSMSISDRIRHAKNTGKVKVAQPKF